MEKSLVDILWINICAVLVFFMQMGFALLEAGLTRGKNSINVALKNLSDLAVSVVAYWAVGFALMFGTSWNGLLGTKGFFFSMNTLWEISFFFFQVVFCSTAATIVSGAVAERVKFSVYLISTFVLSLCLYPVVGHWAWGGAFSGEATGWLAKRGFVDFAGSTVVHSVGGWMALAYLLLIGPRKGAFQYEHHVPFIASNIPMAIGGVFVLWFGWFGFNGGSGLIFGESVPRILVNTLLAGCSGMLAGLFLERLTTGKYKVDGAINGALAGLVGITANCHAVDEGAALVIGAVAGVVAFFCSSLLIKRKIDDAVGAVPVHLGGGIWGTLAVALFGKPEWLGTGLSFWEQFTIQIIGIGTIGGTIFFLSLFILWVLKRIVGLRVSEEIEEVGLNFGEHGVKTEGYDLLMTIKQQALTGDLSRRVPVDPFTELGVIGYYYNKALEEIEKHVVSKEDYLQIMENISEGLCLINRDYTILPSYSKYLENILEEKSLGGKNIFDVFSPHLSPKNLHLIKEYFELCFDEHIAERVLKKANPFERMEFFFDNLSTGVRETKFLSAKVIRVLSSGMIEKLFLLIQDETSVVVKEKEAEETRQRVHEDMELLYKIVHLDSHLLEDFLSDAKKRLHMMNTHMKQFSSLGDKAKEKYEEFCDSLYRDLHTMKGNARLLELEEIASLLHTMEEHLQKTKQIPHPTGENFVGFITLFSELQKKVAKIYELVDRLALFQKERKERFFDHVENFIKKIASQMNKKVVFFSEGEEILHSLTMRKGVQDCIIQMVRNAMVHGIESPEERKAKGKQEEGIIRVKIIREKNFLEVSVFDDGRGLDFERIRQKAKEKGWLKEEQSLTPQEMVKFIFMKGFSTAETLSYEAGRGIGMDIIYTWVTKQGGKIIVKTVLGGGTEFVLKIPLASPMLQK